MNIWWRRYKPSKLQPSNAVWWSQIEPLNFYWITKFNTSWIELKILPHKIEKRAKKFQQVLLNSDIVCMQRLQHFELNLKLCEDTFGPLWWWGVNQNGMIQSFPSLYKSTKTILNFCFSKKWFLKKFFLLLGLLAKQWKLHILQ